MSIVNPVYWNIKVHKLLKYSETFKVPVEIEIYLKDHYYLFDFCTDKKQPYYKTCQQSNEKDDTDYQIKPIPFNMDVEFVCCHSSNKEDIDHRNLCLVYMEKQ